MKLLSYVLLLLSISFSAVGEESEPAKAWLERLSNALNKLNFSTSFVVVKNNQAQPYHWFHGVDDTGTELEILSLLNGPRRDILRKGNTVSYIEPELPPYSVTSQQISGPIPAILAGDISQLENIYDFISVGRSRVLGRPAQLIRIEAKNAHRYAYWLWLDQQSSMLLKLSIVTKQGQQLEQIQFTHLEITDKPSESVLQLNDTELPVLVDIPQEYQQQELQWNVNWLPEGFTQINTNRHKISLTKQPVEFMLLSDGLVDISIYVNGSQEKQRNADFAMDGATLALNQVNEGIEVSVVGKIPSTTAKAIADSITIKPPKP
ncbi:MULTISPECIES: MucB/RseB C-terminal domain-containing protein [unclassified Colwellia]|uniref:MucB/RseB C-terminal domain-containing protein n=1 Tax=unclassified Colwellia TaxID=196834 RepID=UPI0015F42BB1|nr:MULTISPECIES: MucB/RseB C-terminal domain-containing protein [unclassified Colwellia]MBA6233297.1 MucB/RseB C-terminal domain-containing protein [Colwellia sp. MB02u-7]MBA6236387.1 MucB/RseB C-terminal domain-containing protein [Colwellia sp. MB02u-11]MBA6256921.1 MucB/RseB C-terminal domain-containing protein [Colwellia sp. MB3u-28]MBA6261073.1 MucB/RseB C-terminal domain-containing protein [Colwellia sp. MB3u-41]MBA6298213.1 MucB/RseB C-terminal domain-containing protein [Colwellia sp. MB